MQIRENVLLAPLTTFQIGGLARYFVIAESVEDLKEAIAFAREKELRFLALGGGSNVLIADDGFDGLVIKVDLRGIETGAPSSEEGAPVSRAVLIAAAGESWDAVVKRAVGEQLWGIENLSGIPGSVGGAVAQNIGAYGAAISEVVEWVEVFDSGTDEIKKMAAQDCAFDYRDSLFKHDNGRHIVLRTALRLSKIPRPNLSYRDLKNRLPAPARAGGQAGFGDRKDVSLREIRGAVLAIRKEKFPDLAKEGTAGSFFKNPIVSASEAEKLREQYGDIPLFSMPETTGVKIPLAWLLDHQLRLNGFRLGKARLFERQPLVIVADRGATAKDVKALVAFVRQKVKENFEIEIEAEVKIM